MGEEEEREKKREREKRRSIASRQQPLAAEHNP